MSKKNFSIIVTRAAFFSLTIFILLLSAVPLMAQTDRSTANESLKSLRSDVGIIGLTANFDWLNHFSNMGSDTLKYGSNSEIEFVLRDVRMISPRVGVGFQILTSFFVNGSDFGVGSWGLGPVLRFYPLKTDRLQPYLQAGALMGNNMGVGELADTRNRANGFRVRLGLRAGVALRVSNSVGFFIEVGPDWESSALFKADARTMQVNFGIDLYRFKR